MAKTRISNISRPGASAGASISPAITGSDAQLIRLGAALDAAWQAQLQAAEQHLLVSAQGRAGRGPQRKRTADASEAAYFASANIVNEIEALTPVGIAGLAVKAHALRWCHQFKPFIGGEEGEENTTDWRLISQIVDRLDPLPPTPASAPASRSAS